jgi:hypothetical protein
MWQEQNLSDLSMLEIDPPCNYTWLSLDIIRTSLNLEKEIDGLSALMS